MRLSERCPNCHETDTLWQYADRSIGCNNCRMAWNDEKILAKQIKEIYNEDAAPEYLSAGLPEDLKNLVILSQKAMVEQLIENVDRSIADMSLWLESNPREDVGAIEWYKVWGARGALIEVVDVYKNSLATYEQSHS